LATRKNYGSSAEIQNYWIENIAPNYFDFDNINNFRAGIFGYINEVMSVSLMDTHNSINIARREFYPVSAINPRSFYKMAALQQIGLPTAVPARCKAFLLLDQKQVLENSKMNNGVYTCVIDRTARIMANDKEFCLLYPIIIVSSEVSGEWVHTIHYDKSITNDLDIDPNNNNYIVNRVINRDGKHYLMLSVILYQCTREMIPGLVTTDSTVETVSIPFDFEGDLANFEVFYLEDPDSSTPVQLVKLMEGQAMVNSPFCYYRLISENKLEISFPRNVIFTPELNSEIRLEVFTSIGSKGNFPKFKGELSCEMDSEDYPYNNNMMMIGVCNGAAVGGQDIPNISEYKENVKTAYATNKTITSENDLQHIFDQRSSKNSKIVFRKKRADAFDRLYGAYILLKDDSGNVIPTNTLTVNLHLRDFDAYNDATSRAVIRPGTLFEYDESTNSSSLYTGKIVTDLELTDDLSSYDTSTERFLYTNPFLIMATLYPNLVGYYINSMSESRPIEYTYINDGSIMQFIADSISIDRNAIEGEDFYKITVAISPTQDIDLEEVISVPNPEEDEDYAIYAEQDGYVKEVVFDETMGTATANLVYADGSTDQIQVGSFVNQDSDDEDGTDDGFFYHTGYKMNVKAHDSFTEGDLLATKKITDLGKIRACIDMEGLLLDNGLYIPFVIEEYDEEVNVFTMAAYLSTDDVLDNDNHLLIRNGIHEVSGGEDEDVSIPYKGLQLSLSIFYKTEITITHRYSSFDYLHSFTLTNTYKESSDDGIALIKPVEYIRSTLLFSRDDNDEEEGETDEYELPDEESEEDLDDDILITIKEIPLAKANWIKSGDNFSFLISTMSDNYETLQTMYYDLENNYNFDLKFYNTYGKSLFFKVGIRNTWQNLSRVSCSFRFGVYLSAVVSRSTFLEKFREYIKNYVESINSMNQAQQNIYIMTMIKEVQKDFSEIGFMEYYGFNDFNESIQKIEPVSRSEMSNELLLNYIPEFINITTYEENGELVPDVQVEFLENAEE